MLHGDSAQRITLESYAFILPVYFITCAIHDGLLSPGSIYLRNHNIMWMSERFKLLYAQNVGYALTIGIWKMKNYVT